MEAAGAFPRLESLRTMARMQLDQCKESEEALRNLRGAMAAAIEQQERMSGEGGGCVRLATVYLSSVATFWRFGAFVSLSTPPQPRPTTADVPLPRSGTGAERSGLGHGAV